MDRPKTYVILLVVGLIFLNGCITQEKVQPTVTPTVTPPPTTPNSDVVETIAKLGDTVTVDYTGKFEDGTTFDTSEKDVALDSSVPKVAGFQIRDSYAPLSFKLGAGEVISGFEEAIVGMKVEEVKQVTLSPEKAYGPLAEKHITYTPRSFTIPRLENITNAEVHAKLGIDPVKGERIYLTDLFWGDSIRRWDNATIYDIYWKKGIVTLYHEPLQGSKIEIPIGIIQITIDDDFIIQTLTPEINKTGYTKSGDFVTALEYDDQKVKIAHTLAGKTLVFKIKLEKIS